MTLHTHRKPNGVVLYRGPSQLDSRAIVVIAVGTHAKSGNRKTGAMLQTYILSELASPVEAIRTGIDASICGDCKYRAQFDSDGNQTLGRRCYVNLGQGPTVVYKSYRAGKYGAPLYEPMFSLWNNRDARAIAAVGRDRKIRIGTYGDPAAVPSGVWKALLSESEGHTGYTHQWDDPRFEYLREFCMASVDSEEEAEDAQILKWRTFRVALPDQAQTPVHTSMRRESLCPASEAAGKKLTCEDCLACDGNYTHRRGTIMIPAHGGTAVMANVRLAAIRVVTQSA